MDKQTEIIAAAVAGIWEKGVVLSDDTLFFLESSQGITTPEELENALEAEDFPDREMILEMIFFPDRPVRMALEPLLAGEGLEEIRISEVTGFLAGNRSRIRLHCPEGGPPINLKIPREQIDLFIARLYLNRSIPPDICDALATHHPWPTVLSCRVYLRCKNFRFKARHTRFITRFIRKARDLSQGFTVLFELFCHILSRAGESDDLEFHIWETRRHETETLRQIQKFEQKRDRYNMEYLMMSKYQVPPDSAEAVERRIQQLDVIIHDILCLPPLPDTFFPISC